jgi:hypothetical protein
MAKDGAVTKMSWQAAKFLSYTYIPMPNSSKENCIALNAFACISRESITDSQFQT